MEVEAAPGLHLDVLQNLDEIDRPQTRSWKGLYVGPRKAVGTAHVFVFGIEVQFSTSHAGVHLCTLMHVFRVMYA